MLATAVGVIILLGAVAVPALAYVHFSEPDTVLDRHGAPESSLTDAQLRRFAASAAASPLGGAASDTQQPPLILSYHDIQPNPEPRQRYTVTPQQLTDHLAMLRAMGYTSISSRALVDWLDGTGDLPERPVLLTFDDGTAGLWSHADAVLEAQGFTGVAFVISSRIGQHRPYYLTAQELDRLAATGRWEIHSHTRDGHDRVPTSADPDAERLPALISRAYLADEQRVESRAEFEARIRDDLVGSVADLAPWSADGDPLLFSYPFSADSELTADPDATVTASDVVADVFDVAFTNVLPDRLVSERDRRSRLLPRVEVFRATSTADLFTRITQAVPLPPRTSSPLADPADWTDTSGESLAGAATGDVDQGSESSEATEFDVPARALTLHAGDGDSLSALHLPGRSADWTEYRVRSLVDGLGTEAGGPTGSLLALLGSDEQVQVSTSATYVRVRVGPPLGERTTVFEQPLPAADSRMLSVEVAATEVAVFADGVELTRFPLRTNPTGGIAVAANDGSVRFSAMRLEEGGAAPSTPNPTSGFEVTSGEWEGVGDLAVTDAPVFRARTLSSHGDVTVSVRFRIEDYLGDGEQHDWDGVHLGLRYASPDDLYYVSVARRDGTIAIKRKAAGVYETLAQTELPLGVGEWHDASVTVSGATSGVAIVLTIDGQPVLSTIDAAAPIVEPGRVAVRTDNVRVELGGLIIRDL